MGQWDSTGRDSEEEVRPKGTEMRARSVPLPPISTGTLPPPTFLCSYSGQEKSHNSGGRAGFYFRFQRICAHNLFSSL